MEKRRDEQGKCKKRGKMHKKSEEKGKMKYKGRIES
jgi:hypothetical protein